jgi:hypothetical protein
LEPVLARPRAREAVRHLEPTTLVPLVELEQELSLVPLMGQVPRRTMSRLVLSSMVQVPSMVTSATGTGVFGNTKNRFPAFPTFPRELATFKSTLL